MLAGTFKNQETEKNFSENLNTRSFFMRITLFSSPLQYAYDFSNLSFELKESVMIQSRHQRAQLQFTVVQVYKQQSSGFLQIQLCVKIAPQ